MTTREPIAGVIFDLGGVVLGSPLEGIAEYEAANGIPKNWINISITTRGRAGAFQRLERGEYGANIDKFYDDFQTELTDLDQIDTYNAFLASRSSSSSSTNNNNNLVSDEEMANAVKLVDSRKLFHAMLTKSASVDPDFYHAIFVLRGSGIITAALTNNFAPMGRDDDATSTPSELVRLLKGIFDVVVESAVEGVRKPDPRAYLLTCERMGLRPAQVAFLDDIRMNLKAARELGITTVHVELKNKVNALKELERHIAARARPTGGTTTTVATAVASPATTWNITPSDDFSFGNDRLLVKPDKPTTVFYAVGNRGGRIVADLHGNAFRAHPMVLLHGGGQTRFAWGNTALELAREGRCVLNVDMKGHGSSYWDEEDREDVYLYPDYASDLDKLMDRTGFGDRQPILVGASLGGLATLSSNAALSAGGVVLVDVTPRLEKSGVVRVLEFMRDGIEEGFKSLEEVAERIRQYTPLRQTEGKERSLEGLKKNLRFDDRLGVWRWRWHPKFIRSQLPTPDQLDFMERAILSCASSITCPTLLIRGKLTDLVSEAGIASLKAGIPHAEVVDVAGAAHMVAGDKNDVFTDALVRFVRRVVASSEESGQGTAKQLFLARSSSKL